MTNHEALKYPTPEDNFKSSIEDIMRGKFMDEFGQQFVRMSTEDIPSELLDGVGQPDAEFVEIRKVVYMYVDEGSLEFEDQGADYNLTFYTGISGGTLRTEFCLHEEEGFYVASEYMRRKEDGSFDHGDIRADLKKYEDSSELEKLRIISQNMQLNEENRLGRITPSDDPARFDAAIAVLNHVRDSE